MSEVGDFLQTALDLMREKGWTRRVLVNKDGEMCARGALVRTENLLKLNDADARPLRFAAEKALVAKIPADFEKDPQDMRDILPQYNNSRQDFSEVEAWFEKSIAEEGTSLK